jgi:uncharacterized protein YndB with AHSA1/START domain
MSDNLPPIVREVSVSWPPAEAYRRFVEDFGRWWPRATHSVGGPEVTEIVLEPRVGGRIFERHESGRRFQWGCVLACDPPRSIRFTWHPSRDESTAQDVVLTFHPRGTGTRVELVSSGWEKWGKGAKGARRGYDLGWGYVLDLWAGMRTAKRTALDALAAVMGVLQRLRGGHAAAIARSGGEIHEESSS